MRKFLMGLIAALIAIALPLGIMSTATAATGSSGSSNDFEFEVVSTSNGEATASTTLSNTQQALIDGATQALWQETDYGVRLTPKAVKDSWKHRIKVVATGANSSQVIYKKSKHRKLVVLKPRSKVRNTGKFNNRRVGFIWTTKWPAIVKYDKQSKQYRHAANLLTQSQVTALQKTAKGREYKVVGSIMVGGKRLFIVIWCGNYIGGDVEMISRLVMVRFAEDLLMESEAESVAKTGVTFDFKVTCPSNGATFNVQGFAWAYGKASSKVTYSQRTRVATIGDLEYQAKQNISINQSTEADAQSSVKITGTCGSQEETYQAPTASGAAKACVAVGGQNGVITASGTNPNAVAAPGTLTIGGQTKQFASVGAGQTVTWDFSGFAPGNYNGSFSLGAPINKSVTFPVTVNPCPVQEHKNPTAEIFFGEHAVDLHGTMPVFGRTRAFDGAIATLGSPVVTPNDLGMISNWRPVSTERDGVTPCESGWVCYQGTFRVTKNGTPGTYVYGTMVATATDNQDGEFTTQPKQFSVYYADHPDM